MSSPLEPTGDRRSVVVGRRRTRTLLRAFDPVIYLLLYFYLATIGYINYVVYTLSSIIEII